MEAGNHLHAVGAAALRMDARGLLFALRPGVPANVVRHRRLALGYLPLVL